MTAPTDQQQIDAQVREILASINVVEPGGDWSVYDVARILDPEARNPAHLFDTGAGTQPRPEYIAAAQAAIDVIDPPGRYVGGCSGHLYHLGAAA